MKPLEITKTEAREIKAALMKKSIELSEELQKKGRRACFGRSSFYWHTNNYNMLPQVVSCLHFINKPCDWGKIKANNAICICETSDGKHWLHTHKVGKCPWRIY